MLVARHMAQPQLGHTKGPMKVRNKLILIVSVSLLLTAVPGIVLLYIFAERNAMVMAKDRITSSVAKTLAYSMQRFAQSEP